MTRIWIVSLTNRRKAGVTALGAVIFLAVLLAVLWQVRPVQISYEGQTLNRLTFKKTVGEALLAAGVAPGAHDRIEPGAAAELAAGIWAKNRITVIPAFPVMVTVSDQSRELMTAARTIGEAINEAGLAVGPLDKISPAPGEALRPGQDIRVVRVERRTRSVVEKVPYQVIRREDESLERGQEALLREGHDGEREVILEEELEDGRLVRQAVLEEKVIREPVPEVLAYGTISVVSRGGRSFSFKTSMMMKATAYTPGPESNPWGNGYTYTGIKAGPGIAAVDPRVIPLGSRLYVEGYGYALAADIGGAIKGNRIDVCYNEVPEALRWGVRTVKVYVLDE